MCMERIVWRAIPCSKDWCLACVRHRQPWLLPIDKSPPHCRLRRRRSEQGQFGTLDDAEKLRSSLRRTMWGQVGVIRSGESLIRACAQLSRWAQLVTQPFASRAALEVKNMVQVAQCVAEAALWRENSVGAHYRSDFPEAKRPDGNNTVAYRAGKSLAGRASQKSRGLLLSLRGRIG